MDIKRSGSQPSGKGPAEYFTGTVRLVIVKLWPGKSEQQKARLTVDEPALAGKGR